MKTNEILNEIPMSMAQLKGELERIKKRDKELNFRAAKTEDYLNQVIEIKNSEELFKKLTALNIPRLKEQHMYKIIDVLPTTVDSLKVILQGYTLTVNNQNLKKIADTIKGFLAK
jgi:DNA-directed RNA polymerase subunit F